MHSTSESTEVEASHTYRSEQGRAYLRLLHFVLSVHLCDYLIHVGLQDHAAHHHLCQNVVNLRNMRFTNIY